jgi:dTDP-4-dehydrorhamnose reductase
VDLAGKMVELIQTERYGLYHITNSGNCTWYEFAAKIFELAKLLPDLSPTTTEAFGAKATRPSYSVLVHRALAKVGLAGTQSWNEALTAYLRARTS